MRYRTSNFERVVVEGINMTAFFKQQSSYDLIRMMSIRCPGTVKSGFPITNMPFLGPPCLRLRSQSLVPLLMDTGHAAPRVDLLDNSADQRRYLETVIPVRCVEVLDG